MAQFVTVLVAQSIPDLEAAANTVLSTLLSHTILGIQFVAGDASRYNNTELRLAISYRSGGAVITHPYQVVLFDGAQPTASVAAAQAFIAANPTYWFGALELQYIVNDGRTTKRNPCVLPYNASAADGVLNWSGAGGAVGPAGGDLTGAYPNPTVAGLWNVAIQYSVPVSGATLVYDAVMGKWVYATPTRYFATGALAQAAAPFINGTIVVINPGSIPAEAGTYQVTSNQGVAFPADYTLISIATTVDTDISLTDPGGYFPGLSNVSQALQGLASGNPTIGVVAGPIPTVIGTLDSLAFATPGAVEWLFKAVKGTTVYASIIVANTDAAGNANSVESDVVVTPGNGTFDFTLSVDYSAGSIRLRGVASTLGWSYTVKRRGL